MTKMSFTLTRWSGSFVTVSRLIFAAVIGQNGHAGPLNFPREPSEQTWFLMSSSAALRTNTPPATGNPRVSLGCQSVIRFRAKFRCVRVDSRGGRTH